MEERSPVFIKIEEYRQVLDVVDVLKKQVDEIRQTIDQVKTLRAEEEEELVAWESNVNEIEKKVTFIDQTLFEPEQ